MKKNEFTKKKSLPLLERMLRIEAAFESVVSEYYRNAPKEKGKETVFYRENDEYDLFIWKYSW